MLRSLFPRDHRRFLSLPLLGPIADGFDDWLASNGYTQLSRKRTICELRHVNAELQRRRIQQVSNLTLAVLDDCWGSLIKKYFYRAATVRALGRYLAANSLIVPRRPATAASTASILIEEYANFLSEVRGLAAPTISHRRYTARCFLQHLDKEGIRLRKIQATQIESYITKAGKRLSRAALQNEISALRGFLRFLATDGRAPDGLASQIDTPRLYRLEKLPRSLPWETVRASDAREELCGSLCPKNPSVSWLDLSLLIEGQLLSQKQDFRAEGRARAEKETEKRRPTRSTISGSIRTLTPRFPTT